MGIENAELLDYAVAKFQNGKYEEALEAFILTYSRGYEQEWILENIYNCYMDGNDEEFQNAYGYRTEGMNIAYDDCVLDFIPYRNGEYYIFDKEIKIFRGIFSIHDLRNTAPAPSLLNVEFSAAVLELDWNWNEEKDILQEAKNRKLYAVCHDMKRGISFWKIPELAEYLKNIKLFSDRQELQNYFHKNTSEYLPKIICGKEENKKELLEIMNREHLYRLTPEGRNTDNVLLTIGIPTHDRGNLVLKRLQNLLTMQYDAEIEIAISKNGTNFYQEEYEAVSRIPDARINYYDHGKELKYNINWAYVMEMAHGKYVLMVSDEDDVVISALEHYLKLLSSNEDLSLVRAKTTFQYAKINERKYGKKGIKAFQCEFLLQNYLSSLIIRREDFLQENLLDLERFSSNIFYQFYPHEWWCAVLSQKGDYMEEPVALIDEKESVIVEETNKLRQERMIEEKDGIIGNTSFPTYATYQARLEQFKGQIEFLHFFCGDNKELIEMGLGAAICKADSLFELARNRNYDCDNFMNMVDQYASLCIEAIEGFPLGNEQKRKLLILTNNCCVDMYNLHVQLSDEA